MGWFALAAVAGARAGVGDGEGEGFELGDQGAEPAVVVDPLAVVVELLVGHEPGNGLAGHLPGPLPVGAVQDGRVGVAGAAGLAAADAPFDQRAGQREAYRGELGGDGRCGSCCTIASVTGSMTPRR